MSWIDSAPEFFNKTNSDRDLFSSALGCLIEIGSHNRGFRTGFVGERSSTYEFFPINKFFSSYEDLDSAIKNVDGANYDYPKNIQNAFGKTVREQLIDFLKMNKSICVEYDGKNFIGDTFGYKFKKPLTISINPADITQVARHPNLHYLITTDGIKLEVTFRSNIVLQART